MTSSGSGMEAGSSSREKFSRIGANISANRNFTKR
jgi:hypothetical protein